MEFWAGLGLSDPPACSWVLGELHPWPPTERRRNGPGPGTVSEVPRIADLESMGRNWRLNHRSGEGFMCAQPH